MATSKSEVKIDKKIGEILLDKGIISRSQLDIALKRQNSGKGKYLGQILMEMGVPQEKITQILIYSNKRKRIGEILIDLGVITAEELEKVLEKQKQLKEKNIYKPLGILVVESGYTTNPIYLKVLSKHFNMPIESLTHFIPCPSLQRSIGEKFAHKNRIMVLENKPNSVKLGLPEPTPQILDELRRIFPPGKKVEFYLVSPYDIEKCYKMLLNPFSMNRYL